MNRAPRARVIVDRVAAELSEHGVETPRVDAEWLVAHVAGMSRSELAARDPEVDGAAVWPLALRRARREPLAYVLGEWGFRGLTLRCDPRALVPRPETEVVVERCLELVRGLDQPRVLDVGTGTGAIALSLAAEARADVVATDASTDALALTRENAHRTGLDVELVHGDLRDGLPPGPFDIVVSNPPYVRADEWATLPPEVREWEPRDALVDTGQALALVERGRDVLGRGGHLVLEVHEQRAAEVADALWRNGYVRVTIKADLAGRERVVEGEQP